MNETTTTPDPQCPPGCQTASGNCPRCYAETGIGCDHGPLCPQCAREAA